jgi:hypothetical protein
MSLEVLPFQDQFTNLLTQLLLTTRQNLANVTFIDSDLIDKPEIDKIEGWGERWFRGINTIAMSFRRAVQKQQSDPRSAVISHKLPQGNTQEIISSMKVVLDTLERVLVMSAQEVGQSASHEQTREEVKNIAMNTSVRVTFTSIGVDVARDSMKRQLYYALMAYGKAEIWVQVPMDEPMDEESLKKLGFTVGGKYDPKTRKQYLKANKTALAYESFASDRDGEDRVNDAQTANAMVQLLDKIIANQNLFAAVGAQQCIDILNQICKYMQFPRDFKIVNTGQTQGMVEQVQDALGQLKQMMDEQVAQMTEGIKEALSVVTEKNTEQDEQLQQLTKQMTAIIDAADNIDAPQLPSPGDFDAVPATSRDMSLGTAGIG